MTDTRADEHERRPEREDATGKRAAAQAAPIPIDALSQRAGLDLVRAMMQGELPRAPIADVLNFRPVEIEAGRIVFEGTPTPAFFNPIGSIHGGWTATLLDSCVGCAVHPLLLAGKGYTTVERKINFIRPIMPNSGRLRAEGKVIHVGGRIGTAVGRLTDAAGRLYAHASTACLIFDFSEMKR